MTTRGKILETTIVEVVHEVLAEVWEPRYVGEEKQRQDISHIYGLMFLDLLSGLNTILNSITFFVCCCFLVSGVRRKEMKDNWSEETESSPNAITF